MKFEETEFLPVALVLVCNVNVLEVELVFWDVDLDVLTALELDVLAFRKLDGEFLDEGRNVVVGNDLTLKLLDAKGAFVHLDLEVVLYLYLAAEPPAVLDLLAVEEADLGREDFAAAVEYLNLALAAVGLAATG